MKVISDLGRVKIKFKKPVIAIGVFDGVHLGHQFLLKNMVARAKKIKGTSIVVTFYPHPSHVLNPKKELPFLITLKERLRLLEKLGVNVCVVIDFSKAFSRIKAEDFIQNFLITRLHPREIYVGKDFVFGSDRKGNTRLLDNLGRKNNFKVKAVSAIKLLGRVVSSTLIRSLIKRNQLFKAGQMLNRQITISGKAIKGAGKGRKLGFPTVNIKDYDGMLPGLGSYISKAYWGKKQYSGMAFIGRRQRSAKYEGRPLIEVNLFDFRRNIYGNKIRVEFLKKLRDEKRFSDDSSLITQLKLDCRLSKKTIKSLRQTSAFNSSLLNP